MSSEWEQESEQNPEQELNVTVGRADRDTQMDAELPGTVVTHTEPTTTRPKDDDD